MKKLFGKQRLALLRQSRFGRYLGYAIGEIILVVIGILIALSLLMFAIPEYSGFWQRILFIGTFGWLIGVLHNVKLNSKE